MEAWVHDSIGIVGLEMVARLEEGDLTYTGGTHTPLPPSPTTHTKKKAGEV